MLIHSWEMRDGADASVLIKGYRDDQLVILVRVPLTLFMEAFSKDGVPREVGVSVNVPRANASTTYGFTLPSEERALAFLQEFTMLITQALARG
jgi:hypothetical protein